MVRSNVADFWDDRNVFVTGCTGILGSWLAAELVQRGANVVALVRDRVPDSLLVNSEEWKAISCVHGEVEDYDVVERALNEYEIETVFHLAAQTIVGIANRGPLSTFESNIKGTWVLLEAVRRTTSVRRVVIASSDKAYGEHEQLPYDETFPLRGRHPYDVSKSCADLIAQSYNTTYGLPVSITRCGNLYGGGDLNWNRIIPGTIKSLLHGEPPIIRSDGTFVRDYFFVKDAVYAYMGLAEAMEDERLWGEAFNFSNEIQVNVLELVRILRELMNCMHLEPRILDETRAEIPHQYLSAEKARRILGWKRRYELRQGLQETIEWYRNFLESRRSRVRT
ncbi:MAG: GDP-mannose 4,6-dehydratase [Candidatus Krumholzibacteriia bacterium]